MSAPIVALDLGGTWIKGAAAWKHAASDWEMDCPLRRQNPLHMTSGAEEFVCQMADFCLDLTKGVKPRAVAAATAGEVDAAGRNYLCAGAHLGVMGAAPWVDLLAERLDCPVTLINDTEALLLGVAGRGQLAVFQNVGGLAIGTGLGFAMVRQGRWWKPARRLVHFGAMATQAGNYDQWLSFSRLMENGATEQQSPGLDSYLEDLAGVMASAVHVFHLDALILGGGVVDALRMQRDLANDLSRRMAPRLLPGYRLPQVHIVEESNRAILEGALALAGGEETGRDLRPAPEFEILATESAGTGMTIEKYPGEDIVRMLICEETKAAARFEESVPALVEGARMVAEAVRAGGRVVYVGAGSSGRIAALDAVEIPCTFGLPADRFLAVIAGGVADAALSVEEQCEEDISSVADLLLLNLRPRDVVVGISASGSARFVRSALAFARTKKCRTIFVHEAKIVDSVDLSIPLRSGPEGIRGSTRLKAGTAAKKALNTLSTTAMVLLGKVRDGEMIDLQCTNEKLRARAVRILAHLSGKSPAEARLLLMDGGYHLRSVLEDLEKKGRDLPSEKRN